MSAPATEGPFLERFGVGVIERLAREMPPREGIDAVHVINAEERAAMQRVVRRAVWAAAAAGALSALATGVAAIVAGHWMDRQGTPTWGHTATYWAIVGGVTAVASVLEIGFLYWDSLRAVHALSYAANVHVLGKGDDEARAVALALARAALELPNPPQPALGVDPLREASRPILLVASMLYKLKIALTTFVLKAVLRGMLGRLAARSVLELVAVPVTAAWNAWICWLVLREARLRAVGPSAIEELIGWALPDAATLSPEGRATLQHAVGSAIVRTRDLHPNLAFLLGAVRARAGAVSPRVIDDSQGFLRELPRLPPDERRVVLRLLTVAAVVDGRLTAAERRLLQEAGAAAGCPLDGAAVERLRRDFLAGRELGQTHLDALLPA